MSILKRIFGVIIPVSLLGVCFLWNTVNAQFEVIPENSNGNIWTTVENIAEWWKVWENYREESQKEDLSLWDQFASGIMTRDTILDYAVYLVKFIGQLALLVWALWIIYYGYVKATEHLKGSGWGKLGKVVLGILVISFAYVIVKMIWSMFVS